MSSKPAGGGLRVREERMGGMVDEYGIPLGSKSCWAIWIDTWWDSAAGVGSVLVLLPVKAEVRV